MAKTTAENRDRPTFTHQRSCEAAQACRLMQRVVSAWLQIAHTQQPTTPRNRSM